MVQSARAGIAFINQLDTNVKFAISHLCIHVTIMIPSARISAIPASPILSVIATPNRCGSEDQCKFPPWRIYFSGIADQVSHKARSKIV